MSSQSQSHKKLKTKKIPADLDARSLLPEAADPNVIVSEDPQTIHFLLQRKVNEQEAERRKKEHDA
jgi:hypothetical protein